MRKTITQNDLGEREQHQRGVLQKASAMGIKCLGALLFFAFSVSTGFAQNATVTGRVLDDGGQPLPGVNVIEKGTTNGTTTDMDGKFSISVSSSAVLVVTFVGFASQEVTVGSQTNINLSLVPDIQSLSEVVVVGYGTQKKENVSGAIASVGEDVLKDRPLTSASVALQGTTPGVSINQDSGQPGRNTVSIRIRGVGTFNNAAPLVLVDGIEAPLDNINPDDIASLTVLKDAASAAIYGSRAANGVVLVTTKRGKSQSQSGKVNVTYSNYLGITEATLLPNMVSNSEQFATLRNEAERNFGRADVFSPTALQYFRDNKIDTDWIDVIFDKGHLAQHTFGFDGGNEKASYRLSMGYLNEKGLTPRSGSDRLNGRFNLDLKPTDKIKVHTDLSLIRGSRFSSQENLADGGSEIWDAVEATPTFPAYDNQGRIARANRDISGPSLGNPLQPITGNEFKEKSLDILGNLGLDYTPLPGLVLSGVVAVNYRTTNQSTFNPSYSIYDFITGEEFKQNILRGASRGNSESSTTTIFLKANYEKQIQKNYVKILAGVSQENSNSNRFGAGRSNFLSNETRVLDVGDPSTSTNYESGTTWGMQSLFGRLNYNYAEKYLFEANIRLDGTSRLPESNRWGTFPSASVAWMPSKEDFFQPLKDVVNSLKFRASIGQLGNQFTSTTDDFVYARQLSLTKNYNFDGTIVPGVAQVTYGNPDLKWETTTTYNIGMDVALLQSKITVTADYFFRDTKDVLYDVPISSLTGYTSISFFK